MRVGRKTQMSKAWGEGTEEPSRGGNSTSRFALPAQKGLPDLSQKEKKMISGKAL